MSFDALNTALSSIQAAPADPLFGLKKKIAEIRAADPDATILDTTLGVFRDGAGNPFIFPSIVAANQELAGRISVESGNEYLGQRGDLRFLDLAQRLYLGDDIFAAQAGHHAAVCGLGGTGSLRIGAEILRILGDSSGRKAVVFAPKPVWANNTAIAKAAGLEVIEYDYLDPDGRPSLADLSAKVADAKNRLRGGQFTPVFLLHGVCHNPTGLDFTAEQQGQIVQMLQEVNGIAWVDLAYFLLGNGVEQDGNFLRSLIAAEIPTLLAASFSKNAALYRDRVGLCGFYNLAESVAIATQSRMEIDCVRQVYSNPAAHGILVMRTVLEDATLRENWLAEVEAARLDIIARRAKIDELTDGLFPSVKAGLGLFCELGLSSDQVEALAQPWLDPETGQNVHVIMPGSSRINVGFSGAAIPLLCSRLMDVTD